MKVLQINSTCGSGSTGRIATDILDTLEKNRHGGMIAYGRGTAPRGVESYRIGSDPGVNLHGVLSRITDRQGFYSSHATKKLVQKIEEYEPDIIHLHNIHGYYLNIKILFDFLSRYNKPVVWTLHDCWAFTGHCAHFDFIGCDRWKTHCEKCPQKGEYPSSIMMDNSAKNYVQKKELFTSVENMKIITPSKWLEKIAKSSFLGKYDISTINNGIELSAFKPTESDFKQRQNIADKKTVLGVANKWGQRKGFDDFIQLSKILPEDYVVVLVGLTEQMLGSLPKNVIGITRTENVTQLAEIYSAADVYVNASREETMGLTTAEALACGTPAVVYNATAVPEVVDDSCGIVVEAGDISGLAEAVCKAEFNSDACVERARLFEKNKQYEKYLNLYASAEVR